MKIKLIAAVSIDGAIGKNKKLLWHIPEDLNFYKNYTLNKYCIIGKNTYNSLPPAAKRNRIYLVVGTKDISMCNEWLPECHIGFKDHYEAINYLIQAEIEECIVVGGAKLYKSIIHLVDQCDITWVNKIYNDADALFPINELFNRFEVIKDTEWIKNENSPSYKFTTYKKINI
ncbi:MAG: dihydrofolate reductase [Clostridia bacterium]